MNRILKRPMFRMGGRSDDGIMSVRRGYAEGDQVKEPGYFDKSGLGMLLKGIGTEARKAGAGVYDLGGVPLNAASRFFLGENPGFSGARFFGLGEEEGVDPNKAMFLGMETEATPSEMFAGKSLDLGTAAQADDSDIPSVSNDKSTTTTDTDTKTQELSDNDLKTMYEDLLPLFKSELSADEDELKRQKYLELAKFGANILAQPGGDLIGSVGRAAAPSIEGLTRIAEAKRKTDAAAKAMALEAALKQMDPGELKKNYRELIELGYTPEEAKKYLVERGSGTREATKQNIIERRAKAFVNDGIVETDTAGEKAANTISKFDLDLSDVSKLPDSEAELEKDQYYIKKDGSIRRFDGEKLLTPSDKGFK